MLRFLIYISLILVSFSSKAQELVHLQEGKEDPVPLMGYNAHMAHAPSWDNENFTDALKKLHPQILRYPGGSNSFYWDWKTGWTKSYEEFFPYLRSTNFNYQGKEIDSANELEQLAIENKSKNPFWQQLLRYNSKKPKYNTITNFSIGLDSCQSEAIFSLNLISSTITEELEMLATAKNNGISIKYIELGNELNGQSILSEHFYPSPKIYADTCVKWAREIWAVYPDVQIGVVGGNKNKRTKEWNETLLSSFTKELPTKITQLNFILHYYASFKKPVYQVNTNSGYRELIGYPAMEITNKLKNWKWNVTKDYTTWITEFNILDKKPHEINNKWIHGLLVANQIH